MFITLHKIGNLDGRGVEINPDAIAALEDGVGGTGSIVRMLGSVEAYSVNESREEIGVLIGDVYYPSALQIEAPNEGQTGGDILAHVIGQLSLLTLLAERLAFGVERVASAYERVATTYEESHK